MAYIVYCVIFHSTTAYINRLPDAPVVADREKEKATPLSESQMKEICDKITEYLQTTKVYKNSDLNIAVLSVEVEIHPKNISIAINGYLRKNFFELVNAMRVEEAKRLLMKLNTSGYTVDSIFSECGFSSRSTFFAVFKKAEGKTPTQWMKTN
jgi:AraC-like DNA-binding protein